MSEKLNKLQPGEKVQIGDELNKIIGTVNENIDSIRELDKLGMIMSLDKGYTADEVIAEISPSDVYSGMIVRYKNKNSGKTQGIMYTGPNGNQDDVRKTDNWEEISGTEVIDGGEW